MIGIVSHHRQGMQCLPIRHVRPRYFNLVPGIKKLSEYMALSGLGLDCVLQTVVFTCKLPELWNVGEDKERTFGDCVLVTELEG
jgi:hypothetical protein